MVEPGEPAWAAMLGACGNRQQAVQNACAQGSPSAQDASLVQPDEAQQQHSRALRLDILHITRLNCPRWRTCPAQALQVACAVPGQRNLQAP